MAAKRKVYGECLHCLVKTLIKEKSESSHFDIKEIMLRLMEVIGDEVLQVESSKKRGELYNYWGELLITLMTEIESGEYKA